MLTMDEGVPVRPALDVVALSERSWRVCGSGETAAGPVGMVAYVEHGDIGFEVMLLRPGRVETLHADCLAAALALVGTRMADA